MGERMRSLDWSGSPIGSPDTWPQALRAVVALMINSQYPMFVAWGDELEFLYNDAYAPIFGSKHPHVLGRPFREVWSEIWSDVGPIAARALAGEATYHENLHLVMERNGFPEDTWYSFSYSPVRDDEGRIAGVFCACTETSGLVRAEQRRSFLAKLDHELRDLSDPREIVQAAQRLLGTHLGASRVGYGEVEASERYFTTADNWTDGTVPSRHGTHDLAGFGPDIWSALRRGEKLVVRNVATDPRTSAPESVAAFAAIDTAAVITSSLVKDGHMRAALYVHHRAPQHWSDDDALLVEEVAERTWAAAQRARSEARLRESETRFRDMANYAPVMMWITDRTGYCAYLNRRWYEFTGQEPNSGEGYGWLDAVHPDDRPLAEQAFVSANAEQRDYRVDFRLRRADGVYRWVIDAAAARFAESGEYLGYVGTVFDIDDRREAEAQIAFREEQLRLATEAAEVGLWDLDVATDTLFWPPRVKAMFGISADVPVTMADYYDGLHPDDREHTSAAFAAALDPDKRALYDVEYRTIGKEDGVIRWVAAKGRGQFNADGVCTRVIGTAIDITTRKADEVLLRELNERLEQRVAEQTAERNRVWEMSRDLFAIMGFDGHLKVINPAWETTLGRDKETLLSLSFREQVHSDDHAAVQAMMERLLRGETVERFEDRLLHADGSWRWISWTLVPEGDVFYAVGRDVTAEKERELELKEAQEHLRQTQKLESMGQLTGGVAHDVNNLLTPIMGSLDLLRRRRVGGEREQRMIDGALQSAERARTLVQRLLAFARRQPLQPVRVDVGALVSGMADLVASTSGPRVRVELDIAPDLPAALADPNQLEMAILNLAVNARDAMPDGGRLTIAAKPALVGASDRSALRPGAYVRISVADTGVGMDAATLARAVEPFFSTKGIGKGTGLGLSMAHGLAAQLGGVLNIESKAGLGTCVELWLPVSREAAQASDRVAGGDEVQTTTGTALLVDDEELVRMTTADMLSDLGYAVVEAGSAEAALRLVDAGLRFDLLVTDHLMAGMTGTELAREVRERRRDMPVLVVSGYAEVEGIAPDLPRLTKPFRRDDLATSLAAIAASK